MRVSWGVLALSVGTGPVGLSGPWVWAWLLGVYLGSLLAHEGGHVFAVRIVGGRIRCVTIAVLGGSTEWHGAPDRAGVAAVALAGPAVSLCVAAAASMAPGPRWELIAGLNLLVAIGNLIPLPGSDCSTLLAVARNRRSGGTHVR